MTVLEQAKALGPYMASIREIIHAYPELGNEEHQTAGVIARELKRLGIGYQTGVANTGVVGLLKGEKEGEEKTILLRADIDALPIQEQNDLPFASQNAGKMHACGHDVHTAMLLGAAEILASRKDLFSGNVKFCFQPAEEAPEGGAELMVKEGVLENPKVDFAMGLHVNPTFPIGQCAVTEGPVTACPDFFTIEFLGKGGHGSLPHLAKDPIAPLAQFVTQLPQVRTKINAQHPCVIQLCSFHGGTAPAVIPDCCKGEGTVRVFQKEDSFQVEAELKQLAEAIAQAYGVTCRFHYRRRCFSVVNDPAFAARVRQSTADIFEQGFREHRDMGRDDFCFFSDKVPSIYMPIGSYDGTEKTAYPLHHPQFNIGYGVLEKGAAALAQCALDFLSGVWQ